MAGAAMNWERTSRRILVASLDPELRGRLFEASELFGGECLEDSGGAAALAQLRKAV